MTTNAELAHRFRYHPPKDDTTAGAHQWIRDAMLVAAIHVNDNCPEGREKALAFTKLEEAMFWANAAIARNQATDNDIVQLIVDKANEVFGGDDAA